MIRVCLSEIDPRDARIAELEGHLIDARADAGTLRQAAREEGMLSMYEDGCLKALDGTTNIEEVLRVTQEG